MTSGLFTLQQDDALAHWARETVLAAKRMNRRLTYVTQDLATQLI